MSGGGRGRGSKDRHRWTRGLAVEEMEPTGGAGCHGAEAEL